MVPIEFIVEGVPVSHQTSNAASLQAWKAQIVAEAKKVWTQSPVKGKVKCVMMNFYQGSKASCDGDNMVKPIRDAMNKIIYDDDRQISHSEIIQISNSSAFQIKGASKLVVDAIREEKEFIYVRIEDAPVQTQLPR